MLGFCKLRFLRIAAVQLADLPDVPDRNHQMTAVSPKATHNPWLESARADLRRMGRELVVVRCETNLRFTNL